MLYLENLYIYIYLACLLVSLYPINVDTTEPIRLNIFGVTHTTPGKVYIMSEFKNIFSKF